jgi:hypothetical protein
MFVTKGMRNSLLCVLAAVCTPAHAATYPNRAPIAQYMMASPAAEIALARSAAPPSISGNAEVLVLGPNGYTTAVKGRNGFVCLVERAWDAELGNPIFWNPHVRGPDCLNPPPREACCRTFSSGPDGRWGASRPPR